MTYRENVTTSYVIISSSNNFLAKSITRFREQNFAGKYLQDFPERQELNFLCRNDVIRKTYDTHVSLLDLICHANEKDIKIFIYTKKIDILFSICLNKFCTFSKYLKSLTLLVTDLREKYDWKSNFIHLQS